MYAIVGSRHYRPVELIDKILTRLEKIEPDGFTVVSGGEPTGVDTAVEDCCKQRDYHECMSDPTGLDHLGRAGGCLAVFLPENGSARAKFARNTKVVQHSLAVIALFADGPRSPGTSDTVTKALKQGLPVYVHHEGTWSRS